MPTYEEVFENVPSEKSLESNRPRQLLKKHLEYKDGTKRYNIKELDTLGPTVIELIDRMDGTRSLWLRKNKSDKGNDYWFERDY